MRGWRRSIGLLAALALLHAGVASAAYFPQPSPVVGGGTGLATLTAHGVMVGAGTSPVVLVGPGATAGVALVSGGASADPSFTIVLPVGGGTGLATLTAHGILVGEGTSNVALVGPGATAGVPLVSGGASADPSFTTAVVAGGGTGLTTITAHTLLIGNGTSAPNLTTATAGAVLTETTTSADPAFTVTPVIGVASTTAGTLTLANATTAFSPTIQAPGVTPASYNFNLPLTAGTSGQFLTSAGGGAANMTWTTGGGGTVPTTAVAATSASITLASTNLLTTLVTNTTVATATLPSAVTVGSGFRECIKDAGENFNAHNVTLKSTAGTIDGTAAGTGIVLNQQNMEVCPISDGTNWWLE